MLEDTIPIRTAEQSPCLSAHIELDSWNPEGGRTDKVIFLVGRCDCAASDFDYTVMVLESRQVVVWGGLKEGELVRFRDRLRAKMQSRPIVENDGSEAGIVVPCPPPKPSLAELAA
jgi:hypothetical protein